jgi:hypothetical protein
MKMKMMMNRKGKDTHKSLLCTMQPLAPSSIEMGLMILPSNKVLNNLEIL